MNVTFKRLCNLVTAVALATAMAACSPPDRSKNAHYFTTHADERAQVLRDCRDHKVAVITCTAARNAARLVRTRARLRAHRDRLLPS
jgi:hypothetical protein